uniref:Uncharacterized protein n=1 Tax=Steinernema glaseri TaxID=37863 RepID=A0A1I7YPW1_9BILA
MIYRTPTAHIRNSESSSAETSFSRVDGGWEVVSCSRMSVGAKKESSKQMRLPSPNDATRLAHRVRRFVNRHCQSEGLLAKSAIPFQRSRLAFPRPREEPSEEEEKQEDEATVRGEGKNATLDLSTSAAAAASSVGFLKLLTMVADANSRKEEKASDEEQKQTTEGKKADSKDATKSERKEAKPGIFHGFSVSDILSPFDSLANGDDQQWHIRSYHLTLDGRIRTYNPD